MIAHISGELARVGSDHIIIDVSGVGYLIYMPLSLIAELPPVGSKILIHTYTHVKEDTLSLFGFLTEDEKAVFELLLGVSGIGPKMALNILSVLAVEHLIEAVSQGDHHTLARVPGVGVKTAQRIVIDLQEKAATVAWERKLQKPAASKDIAVLDDVTEGLVALGYPRQRARAAAEQAAETEGAGSDVGRVIKAALKVLTSH